MILKKMLFCIIVLISIISVTNIYATTYDMKNNYSDDINVKGPTLSKIFDLVEDIDGKKVVEKNFDVIDVMKNDDGSYNMRLHYEMPLYLDGSMVKKLNKGDVLNIELSNNNIDVRLKKTLSFEVVDKYLYKKVNTGSEDDDTFFGKKIDFDNVFMYKMIEVDGLTSRYYYVPCVDAKYLELYCENQDVDYRIECDYNVKVDKNVSMDVNRPIVKDVMDLLNHNLNIDKIEFVDNKIVYMHVIINSSGEL